MKTVTVYTKGKVERKEIPDKAKPETKPEAKPETKSKKSER